MSDWNEKLDLLTDGVYNADKVKTGLTTLRNRLQAISHLTPPEADNKLHGQIYLFRPKGSFDCDNCCLQEVCTCVCVSV